mmetsp:Transcript_52155/g.153916  ORF Transcript_52155/g.153916 Transcript_52155/m.153916 type:complete len:428 (-) Transcript_52155:37-1320(-)
MPIIHSGRNSREPEAAPSQSRAREPVVRDLTKAFQRYRTGRKRAVGSEPGSVYPGAQALLSGNGDFTDGEESKTARERAMLPPAWVDHADRAADEIKDIRMQLVQLTKAQQRRLLKVVNHDDADKEVEVLSNSVAGLIKGCERSIHAVRMGTGPNTTMADDEFRMNMQRKLAQQLQEVAQECRQKQKAYMAEVKKRQHQTDVETGVFGDEGRGSSSQAAGEYQPSAAQMQELDNMEEFAAKRSHEIAQIVSSVNDLNTIFKDLAVLVIEQGTVLDRIDYNTEKIYKRADDGRKQMEKAVTRKKANDGRTRQCFMFWGAADALALVVLLIKYQLKYGLKNVFYFLCVVGFFVGSCYVYTKFFGLPSWVPQWKWVTDRLPDISPSALWKKIRPNPMKAAAGAAGVPTSVPGGLNPMRHVWRPSEPQRGP